MSFCRTLTLLHQHVGSCCMEDKWCLLTKLYIQMISKISHQSRVFNTCLWIVTVRKTNNAFFPSKVKLFAGIDFEENNVHSLVQLSSLPNKEISFTTSKIYKKLVGQWFQIYGLKVFLVDRQVKSAKDEVSHIWGWVLNKLKGQGSLGPRLDAKKNTPWQSPSRRLGLLYTLPFMGTISFLLLACAAKLMF